LKSRQKLCLLTKVPCGAFSGERLFVGVLPAETAVVEDDLLALDIVAKTPATEAEAVLTFPRRYIFELLDLMPASTVVGIAAKSSEGLFLNLGKFLMVFLE
jgi:hypothetical protein